MNGNNDNSVNILREEKGRLLERVATIDGLLELILGSQKEEIVEVQVEKDGAKKVTSGIGYDKNKNMRFKVLYIIKNLNRFLHSNEIRQEISRLDNIDFSSIKVSSTLSQLRKSGKVRKIQIGNQNRNSFWGSEKWLDHAGEPLVEHHYDERMLAEWKAEEEIDL